MTSQPTTSSHWGRILLAGLLSAVVIPGAGQLYNRDRRKGFVLMILTVVLFMAFTLGITFAMAKAMPADLDVANPDQVRQFSIQIMNDNLPFVRRFFWLVTAVWLYGVVDACLGARERTLSPIIDSSPPSTTSL